MKHVLLTLARCISRTLLCLIVCPPIQAQTIPEYREAPQLYDFLPNAFKDVPPFLQRANPDKNWKEYLGILTLTGALIAYDQEIINGSQYYARRMHLITDQDQGGGSKSAWSHKVGSLTADLRLPASANSYFYFIGDGLTSLSILGGLAVFGEVNSDLRALNTASQTMESLVLTGMFVVTGKYISGRESPFRATKKGGAWRPLPSVKTYLNCVSKQDAFPSGHIATVMSTVTVLHQNYPEKFWILPAGYSAMGLLMFGMLNNGVHWAGDYPVGIAIGYIAATTVFETRKPDSYSSNLSSSRLRTKPITTVLPFASSLGFGLTFNMKT